MGEWQWGLICEESVTARIQAEAAEGAHGAGGRGTSGGEAGAALTLRRSSPCEMFSASMKADTRWWMGPASPQCGRSTNVWKPRCLGARRESAPGSLRPRLRAGTRGWIPAARRQPSGPRVGPEVGQCWGGARRRAGEGGEAPRSRTCAGGSAWPCWRRCSTGSRRRAGCPPPPTPRGGGSPG